MTIPPSPPQPPHPRHQLPPGEDDDHYDQSRAYLPNERPTPDVASPASPASSPIASSATATHDPSPGASYLPVAPPKSVELVRSPTSRGRNAQRPLPNEQSKREDVAARAARVKQTCRIEDVVSRYGVELTAVAGGRRFVGLCPFHTEQHGSFTVYADTQSFCCFGCHAAGDVITFVC